MSGDGINREFTLPLEPYRYDRDCLLVFIDGLLQDIVINNNKLIFKIPPISATDNIEIVYMNRVSETYDIIKLDGVKTSYRFNDSINPFRYGVGSSITII